MNTLDIPNNILEEYVQESITFEEIAEELGFEDNWVTRSVFDALISNYIED